MPHLTSLRIVYEEILSSRYETPLYICVFLIVFIANECLQHVVLGRVDVSVCLKSTTRLDNFSLTSQQPPHYLTILKKQGEDQKKGACPQLLRRILHIDVLAKSKDIEKDGSSSVPVSVSVRREL